MKAFVITLALIILMSGTAQAGSLKVIEPHQIPRIDMVDVHFTQEFPFGSGGEGVRFHLWALANEPESGDNLAGQMYLGLECMCEGSPTDVYALPIKDVVKIKSVNFVKGLIQVEGRPTSVTKSIGITYSAIDWHGPGEIEKSAKIEVIYSEFGYIDGLEMKE